MKIFNVQVNDERFQIKARDIFAASRNALDVWHDNRLKEVGRRRMIPHHIEMSVTVHHTIEVNTDPDSKDFDPHD